MKYQKACCTKYVNKCLKLVEDFREENNHSSPLLNQAATDLMTFYNRAKNQLEVLEGSMEKYLDLTSQTHTGSDAELDKIIGDLTASVEVYSKSFKDIKGTNIEIFQLIQSTLNPIPPARSATRPVQAAPQVPMPLGFKLNHDLRPALLVKDWTLKEVNNFSETFSNYIQSTPNQTIPPGALWVQVIVNVDQFWLTEVKERKFTKETELEEFLQIIEEVNTVKFPLHLR